MAITELKQPWVRFLTPQLQTLLYQGLFLLEREKIYKQSRLIEDYGFLLFTVAKVYEGFLKEFLLRMELIEDKHYRDEHFRIGKALNPDLPEKYRDEEWIYSALAQRCGKPLTIRLWRVWQESRNEVFHYGPSHQRLITLAEAEKQVGEILQVMSEAVEVLLMESEGGTDSAKSKKIAGERPLGLQ